MTVQGAIVRLALWEAVLEQYFVDQKDDVGRSTVQWLDAKREYLLTELILDEKTFKSIRVRHGRNVYAVHSKDMKQTKKIIEEHHSKH